MLPLCICTMSWFDLQSTAPSINARPGKNTHTLIQVITRCVFSQEAKLLTRRCRYFLMFFNFFFFVVVCFRLGFFINSRQYTCQSVSTVLVCWFEIQVLDAVKWLLSAFSVVRGFFCLTIFFKLIFPKLFLCLCLYDCIPWCLLRALAALHDSRTVFTGWTRMQHLRSISLLNKQYVSALKLISSFFPVYFCFAFQISTSSLGFLSICPVFNAVMIFKKHICSLP